MSTSLAKKSAPPDTIRPQYRDIRYDTIYRAITKNNFFSSLGVYVHPVRPLVTPWLVSGTHGYAYVPDTNHNASLTNPNRNSKGNTNQTNPTNPNTRYSCECGTLNSMFAANSLTMKKFHQVQHSSVSLCTMHSVLYAVYSDMFT